MRTVFRAGAALIVALALFACTSDEKPAASVSFDPAEVVFGSYEDIVKIVTVSANTYWQLSVPAECDWLVVPFRGAGAGKTLLELKALPYYLDEDRTTQISFETFDGSVFTLNVRQMHYERPVGPEPDPEDDLEGLTFGDMYQWE